ncbi:myb-related transcription factor, partner of profilin-like [Pectinophora gossypiella]|uniref:myb-related transcription factor, partner of profilin-like n=1 Tax=Pectinophora gossypiella TaxID=13191 RepID=UPI00214E704B|nr:myb-related transcription factor, partner of profilin-like [Pectinophora gossypiella]XP_049870572.1 myb-related transcription factor, partner of profilin-like [Pectinophora gossypiella]
MDKRQKFTFSTAEKQLLLSILKKHSHIIENKQTDGATLRIKNESWNSVTREFNASPLTTQHVKHQQLRKLWQNLKQRQRDALTKERQHRFATGGGPATEDADIDPDISQITSALIVGLDDVIDSDTLELEYSTQLDLTDSDPDKTQTQTTKIRPPTPPHPPQTPTPSQSLQTPTLPESLHIPTPSQSLQTPTLPESLHTPTPSQSLQTPTLPESLHTQTPSQSLQTPTPPQVSQPLQAPNRSSATIRGSIDVLRMEFEDRRRRSNELHEMQKALLAEQIREARAKAELAEFILKKQKSGDI